MAWVKQVFCQFHCPQDQNVKSPLSPSMPWGAGSRVSIDALIGNLNKGVFERRTSTGSGLFTFLSGSFFARFFSQIVSIRLPANGRNNAQHCCANNVGSCCVRVGSGVQTDATTPNNVGTCSASWERHNP